MEFDFQKISFRTKRPAGQKFYITFTLFQIEQIQRVWTKLKTQFYLLNLNGKDFNICSKCFKPVEATPMKESISFSHWISLLCYGGIVGGMPVTLSLLVCQVLYPYLFCLGPTLSNNKRERGVGLLEIIWNQSYGLKDSTNINIFSFL